MCIITRLLLSCYKHRTSIMIHSLFVQFLTTFTIVIISRYYKEAGLMMHSVAEKITDFVNQKYHKTKLQIHSTVFSH